MVCYFKRICGINPVSPARCRFQHSARRRLAEKLGINQAENGVMWPDLLHRHTIALASFREWSVVSAWLRIGAQPWNLCQPRNSASALTWLMSCQAWHPHASGGFASIPKAHFPLKLYNHLRPAKPRLYAPQFNSLSPCEAYMRHQPMPSLVLVMIGAKPLSDPMLESC